MFDFQEELRKLPDQPGVYLMHDKTCLLYTSDAADELMRV